MVLTGDELLAHPIVNKIMTRVLLVIFLWTIVWALFPEAALPPNGLFFGLFILFKLSMIMGRIVELARLPSLLGMLIAGFVCSNFLNIEFDAKVSSILRSFALAVILLRAGLGLNPVQLMELSVNCLKLAFIPCVVEAFTIGIAGHFILDLPYSWSFLLGFVLAAVSPAVVVPGLISTQEKQLGTKKGIPTLIIAAASVDDVLAITGFGVTLGIVFTGQSSLAWTFAKGPLEAIIGLVGGFLIGILLRHFPVKDGNNAATRLVLVILSGCFAIYVSNATNLGGAGPLAALTMTFVAAINWRKEPSDLVDEVESNLKTIWLHAQPFLFGLIGAEVKLAQLSPDIISYAVLTLVVGLSWRCASVYFALYGSQLNIKEKVFVSMAWLPKATVQAAFGPVALDFARQRGDQTSIDYGVTILTVAVLSIIITAPIGAVLIALTGPRLLTFDGKDPNMTDNELNPVDSTVNYADDDIDKQDTSDAKMVSINLDDTDQADVDLNVTKEV